MRAVWRYFSLLMIGIFIVGCSATSYDNTLLTPGATANPLTRTQLVIWHGADGQRSELFTRLLLEYQRAHPNVVIQIVNRGPNLLHDYRAALLEGTPPDLIWLNENRWVGELADQQLIIDLTERLRKVNLEPIVPAALDGARYGEKLYGLPLTLNLPVLYYNRANFVSTPPQSTAEWLEIARGFSDDQGQYGLAYNLSLYFTQPYLPAFGGAIFDETGAVVLGTQSYTPTLQWLTWVDALAQDPSLLARDDHRLIARSVSQNSAIMTIDWADQISTYRQLWGENVGVQPLPRLSQTGQEPQPFVRSSVLVISPRSTEQQQNAALDVMRFLVEMKAQTAFQAADIPSVRNDLASSDPLYPQLQLAVSRASAWPTTLRFNNGWDILIALVRNSLNGAPLEESIANADRLLRSE
ncbi:sugar ABC transporter substrate-binding protein [Herpetosiphon giganteus]|uniref:sugar ABC transporter substrate-binding protein n=1 Tax=Herpetosiphon giganteus TaxID=2029754 RepID=UPI0019565398|nr:extracellular solute-binding protein [Herpetosiphon giganteus]MBM7843318.1 maltose-binding protein MalE [Herpetosiphon giganteus]